MNKPRWTDEEELFLKSNCNEMFFSDIAKQLSKTKKAVETKSERLGLKVGKRWRGRNQKGELNANWKGGISKNNYKYSKRNRLKFPEKTRASYLLRYRIKKGEIIKPVICSNCRLKKKIEAHHEDYLKPLEVEWLCRKCHIAKHKTPVV